MYKKLLTALLILNFVNASAQLHHQMLSSQGNTSISQKGVVVTQTIGQQSVVGNYSSLGFTFGQGYQQWMIRFQNFIKSSKRKAIIKWNVHP